MKKIIKTEEIQNRIFTIRGIQIMLDKDLAELYEVAVKRLNEQVRRNINRFPIEFRFQLNDIEKNELVANCDRFKNLKHSSVNPYAYTEQGVAMLSAVIHSDIAIKVSIEIINAFVAMKKFINTNAGIFQRLDKIEQKQIETDTKFDKVFKALEDKTLKPKQGIFFDGQVFDAYVFVADLIKSATKAVSLIDNYVDESILQLFTKRNKNVSVKILTNNISKVLLQDIEKHNQQYPKIEIEKFTKAHDRFLIIDDKTIYHFGASLKDLGKKWFAFSKMDIDTLEVLSNLKKK